MSRKLHDAPTWSPPNRNLESFTLRLKTITPMFGGGFETRNVDTVSPIRAAAIRGHLRFWWRTIYGGQFGSAENLFQREAELWGSAEKPGRVQLQVQVTSAGSSRPHSQIAPRSNPKQGSPEGFFLFPFQKARDKGLPEASAQEKVQFQLAVWFPTDFERDLRNTLCAWIALGGVGARARRGCGALAVEDSQDIWLPPLDETERQRWFRNLLSQATALHTTLLTGGSLVWGQLESDPQRVWGDLGRFWAAFRKGHVDIDGYSPTSGCLWRDYNILTQWEMQQEHLLLAKPFLGLPIIYQNFKNGLTVTIKAGSSGRMASPVILKPLALQEGKVCPLVAVLCAPSPEKIRIDDDEVKVKPPSDDLVLEKLGARDPLEAVIKAAEKYWHAHGLKLEILP